MFLAGPGLAAGKDGRRIVLPQNRLMDLRLGRDPSRQAEFCFEGPSRQVFTLDLIAQQGQLAAAEQESGSREAKPRRSVGPFEQIGD